MPVAWDLLWLYDRRTARLVGFTESTYPQNPREINLPAFFGSITRNEQMDGGACSFSEMIQRGGDATSGYFCAGRSCARETTRNQGDIAGDLAATLNRNAVESLLSTRGGNFGVDLACTLERDTRPGTGSAACPGTGGGVGPDAAMLSCVTRQVARPGLEDMFCLAEATGFCSSPVDRIAKDMQMQQYAGIRIGRDCGISQGTIEGPIPVVKPKNPQAVQEARKLLQDVKDALKGLNDPVRELADAGVWDRLVEGRIAGLEQQIKAAENALNAMTELIRETLRLMKEEDDRGNSAERDRLSKLADERIKEEMRMREELDNLRASLERVRAKKEEGEKKTGSAAGIVPEGEKRCVQGAESCGGNSCTAMASAVGRALQCVINRRKAAEAEEVHDPRLCTPEVCDPMEPEGDGGRGGQCLAELDSNPAAAGVRLCWAVRCPSGEVPTVGPNGCTCGLGQFAGSTPKNPVGEMCELMRCTGGDTAQVASMQSGGSCGCAPEVGGGTQGARKIARMLPPVRSLLDLNPNVQEALLPLLPVP